MICSIEYSCTNSKFSIEAFLEEVKPVVTETNEFEYRQLSKIIPFLDFWNHPDFDARDKVKALSIDFCYLCKSFRLKPRGKIEHVDTEKLEIDNRNYQY